MQALFGVSVIMECVSFSPLRARQHVPPAKKLSSLSVALSGHGGIAPSPSLPRSYLARAEIYLKGKKSKTSMQSGSARSGSYTLESPENIPAGNPPSEFTALAGALGMSRIPDARRRYRAKALQLAKCAKANPTLSPPPSDQAGHLTGQLGW